MKASFRTDVNTFLVAWLIAELLTVYIFSHDCVKITVKLYGISSVLRDIGKFNYHLHIYILCVHKLTAVWPRHICCSLQTALFLTFPKQVMWRSVTVSNKNSQVFKIYMH